MMISIGYDGHLSTVCNLFTDEYQNIPYKDAIIPVPSINRVKTMSEMKTLISNPNYVNIQTTGSDNLSNKWLYVDCQFSTDLRIVSNFIGYGTPAGFYSYANNNNITNSYYFDGVPSDFPLRYFFSLDTSTLSIKNANTLTDLTQVYMKNLNLNSQFIAQPLFIGYL
jgi:hypothetical protein